MSPVLFRLLPMICQVRRRPSADSGAFNRVASPSTERSLSVENDQQDRNATFRSFLLK
jgi:hypothetical protein